MEIKRKGKIKNKKTISLFEAKKSAGAVYALLPSVEQGATVIFEVFFRSGIMIEAVELIYVLVVYETKWCFIRVSESLWTHILISSFGLMSLDEF